MGGKKTKADATSAVSRDSACNAQLRQERAKAQLEKENAEAAKKAKSKKKEEIKKMNRKALKLHLKKLGLSTQGTKKDLRARLLEKLDRLVTKDKIACHQTIKISSLHE